MRFQKHEFSLSSTTHRSYRVHATVLIRFRLYTLKRSKKIELPAVAESELYCERDKHARLDIFGHGFHFDVFSTVQTNTICMIFENILKASQSKCMRFSSRVSLDGV